MYLFNKVKLLCKFIIIIYGGGALGEVTPALAIAIPKSQNCVVNDISFPTIRIGNIFKTQPITAMLNFSCSPTSPRYIPNESAGEYITYCWHIHNGRGGRDYNKTGYRGAVLRNNVIWFNFYGEHISLGSMPVGTIERPYNIYGKAKKTGSNTWSASSLVTLKFEHNEDALNFPAGHYQYENTQTHVGMAKLTAKDEFNKVKACGGGAGGDSSYSNEIGGGAWYGKANVDINISTYCNVEQTILDFGTQPQLRKPLNSSVNVHVDCSGGTDYDVSIDNGLYAINGQRRMKQQNAKTPAYIPYSITPNSWSGCGRGIGLPNADYQTISGTIPSQPTPPDGSYKDTLTVSVVYRNSVDATTNPAYCKQQNAD